jgi:hypothetical protein
MTDELSGFQCLGALPVVAVASALFRVPPIGLAVIEPLFRKFLRGD